MRSHVHRGGHRDMFQRKGLIVFRRVVYGWGFLETTSSPRELIGIPARHPPLKAALQFPLLLPALSPNELPNRLPLPGTPVLTRVVCTGTV